MDWSSYPGWELVGPGLEALRRGEETVEALLVSIGAPRLRRAGIVVPTTFADPEHRLLHRLAETNQDTAHGRYNALVRRLVSFERAASFLAREAPLMRDPVDPAAVEAFMRALGERSRHEARVYFTGGVTAVLLGWRRATVDLDIHIVPDSGELLDAIPALKERLRVNVELACPAHFIPALPGWEDRSLFIAREGRLTFLHYDPYAQALAKLERSHEKDLIDVRELLGRGLVDRARLRALFERIEPELKRFPAIDPVDFSRAVDEATRV